MADVGHSFRGGKGGSLAGRGSKGVENAVEEMVGVLYNSTIK